MKFALINFLNFYNHKKKITIKYVNIMDFKFSDQDMLKNIIINLRKNKLILIYFFF